MSAGVTEAWVPGQVGPGPWQTASQFPHLYLTFTGSCTKEMTSVLGAVLGTRLELNKWPLLETTRDLGSKSHGKGLHSGRNKEDPSLLDKMWECWFS